MLPWFCAPNTAKIRLRINGEQNKTCPETNGERTHATIKEPHSRLIETIMPETTYLFHFAPDLLEQCLICPGSLLGLDGSLHRLWCLLHCSFDRMVFQSCIPYRTCFCFLLMSGKGSYQGYIRWWANNAIESILFPYQGRGPYQGHIRESLRNSFRVIGSP